MSYPNLTINKQYPPSIHQILSVVFVSQSPLSNNLFGQNHNDNIQQFIQPAAADPAACVPQLLSHATSFITESRPRPSPSPQFSCSITSRDNCHHSGNFTLMQHQQTQAMIRRLQAFIKKRPSVIKAKMLKDKVSPFLKTENKAIVFKTLISAWHIPRSVYTRAVSQYAFCILVRTSLYLDS